MSTAAEQLKVLSDLIAETEIRIDQCKTETIETVLRNRRFVLVDIEAKISELRTLTNSLRNLLAP